TMVLTMSNTRQLKMPKTLQSRNDLARASKLGRDFYEERLKAVLEPDQNGQTVAVHFDSADYAVASNSPEARRALRARHPEGLIMTMKIGPSDDGPIASRLLASRTRISQQK